MKTTTLTIPELSMIAGTRAMLGGGIGLLVGNRLNREKRQAIGWTLFLIGAVTTIPLGLLVLCKRS